MIDFSNLYTYSVYKSILCKGQIDQKEEFFSLMVTTKNNDFSIIVNSKKLQDIAVSYFFFVLNDPDKDSIPDRIKIYLDMAQEFEFVNEVVSLIINKEKIDNVTSNAKWN